MPLPDLERRYDGPIPPWEQPVTATHHPSRNRRCRHHRAQARLALASVITQLHRASHASGARRLDHWQRALRQLGRFQELRRQHSYWASAQTRLGRCPKPPLFL